MRRVSSGGAKKVFGLARLAARLRPQPGGAAQVPPADIGAPPAEAFPSVAHSLPAHAGTGPVERLTTGVAHDLNNLLQAVSGGLELLGDLVAGDPEAEELVRNISGSASRGASLTHHLLSFCRHQVVSTPCADLNAVTARLRDLLPRTLGSQGAISFGLDAHLPAVAVDPGRIELFMLRAALALFDAGGGCGSLTVQARQRWKAGVAQVVLSVADGRAEALPERVDLAAGEAIAQQVGGALHVTADDGVRIELWLPGLVPAVDPMPAVTLAPPLPSKPRVLLVDDAPDVLITLAAFLEGEGFAVTTARNGRDALEALVHRGSFDVVVTDYAMSGMSGAELLERIHVMLPGLPALVVTGFASVEKLAMLHENIEVLRKPFRRDYLVRRVRALARRGDEAASENLVMAPGRQG